MGAVTLSGVAKRYGGTEVLRDINLSIEEGEFAILVGPSGCGKSTLLRMIAGLEEISGGDISIGGRRVNDLEPKDRDIAMVFQSYALYPHMTVADNMGFALKMARVDAAEKQARITRAAEMLGLTPYLDRYPRALSGGQRQRVAMGRAMVRDPAVFLFDEPLSNLDAKLRVQMRSEIRQTQARLGVTTVYVTHDQIEAMTMADRIIVMNGGRIEQVGTPLDLYDRPANRFVAEFIGSPAMNMIAVTDGRLPDGTALPLIAPAGAVTVGLRPEHLHPGPAGITVQVTGVEPTGAETLITATLAGQPITAALRDRVTVRPGDSLTLGFDPAHLHLFDAGSGQRISR